MCVCTCPYGPLKIWVHVVVVAAGASTSIVSLSTNVVMCTTYLHHMHLRMGCSLPVLVAIPLGPFLSASPSNLVRGPGAGAGPVAARWDGMGGVPRDGFDLKQDGTNRQRGGFILNHCALCLVLLLTPSAMIRGSSVLAGANQCFNVSYMYMYAPLYVLIEGSICARNCNCPATSCHGCHYTTSLCDSPTA